MADGSIILHNLQVIVRQAQESFPGIAITASLQPEELQLSHPIIQVSQKLRPRETAIRQVIQDQPELIGTARHQDQQEECLVQQAEEQVVQPEVAEDADNNFN